MSVMKWFGRGVMVLALVVVGAFLHFYLPTTDVVRVTGTDVKRMDDGGDRPKGMPATTRDVRFINTVTKSGGVRVYRNEDTGWGWPPYFKFDSADVTAKATAILKSSRNPWVAVTSYGWRIQLLSMFPNISTMKVVKPGYTHIPWFSIVFLAIVLVSGFFVVRWFRRFVERLRVDARWDVGRAPVANVKAWVKTELSSWKKKPPKRPPPRKFGRGGTGEG